MDSLRFAKNAWGGSLMKTIYIDNSIVLDRRSIALDRLATWHEVRFAMDSDLSGRACNLPEDVMALVIVSKMSDATSN
jgi:hypothetical protein